MNIEDNTMWLKLSI